MQSKREREREFLARTFTHTLEDTNTHSPIQNHNHTRGIKTLEPGLSRNSWIQLPSLRAGLKGHPVQRERHFDRLFIRDSKFPRLGRSHAGFARFTIRISGFDEEV